MTFRIGCWTLFDITQTGVINRARPVNDDVADWIHRRNTQCNFDTVLQVISMRSQPDVLKLPEQIEIDSYTPKLWFGKQYIDCLPLKCWKFEFEVHHSSVFQENNSTFAALYKDCQGVPMIKCVNQTENVIDVLDISADFKNIHFEEL